MADEYDSDFSDESHNEEDAKMKRLLAEWDDKDMDKDDLYVDSDEEEEDEDAAAKKAALLAAVDSDSDDSEDDSEEEEEVEHQVAEVEEEEDEDEEEEDEEEEEEEDEEEVDDEDEDDEEEEDVEEDEEEEEEEDVIETKSIDTASVDMSDDDLPIVDELKKKPRKKKAKKAPSKITDPSPDDDDEDVKMKELLASWDAENGGDDDDDDDDSDDDSEVSEREVVLEDNVLDHIVLACSDLDKAMADFKKKTGLEAVIAGTIKGLGIKCARVSFTDSTYLEIIAPDPKGPGPIGELIKSKKIDELTPFHYAIRTRRAEALKDEVGKFGYTPDHITMFGAKADGTPRKWEMLYLYGHKLGGIAPFFINWANSDHPCATLPVVGKLKKITIRAPENDPVHKLFDHVGVNGIKIEAGKPKISFSFQSPEGSVRFSTDKAVGFKFPGFEADTGEVPVEDEQDAEVVFEKPSMPELLPVSDDDYADLPPPSY